MAKLRSRGTSKTSLRKTASTTATKSTFSESNQSIGSSEKSGGGESFVPIPRARKKRSRSRVREIYNLARDDICDDPVSSQCNMPCCSAKTARCTPKRQSRFSLPLACESEQLETIINSCPKRDHMKLMFYHLSATFFLYVILYPLVNFVWTYCHSNDVQILTLFSYVTDGPTNDAGYWKHFIRLHWLRWPPTTAESVALLLACAVKDTIVIHWQGIAEDLTLTDMICMSLASRKRCNSNTSCN